MKRLKELCMALALLLIVTAVVAPVDCYAKTKAKVVNKYEDSFKVSKQLSKHTKRGDVTATYYNVTVGLTKDTTVNVYGTNISNIWISGKNDYFEGAGYDTRLQEKTGKYKVTGKFKLKKGKYTIQFADNGHVLKDCTSVVKMSTKDKCIKILKAKRDLTYIPGDAEGW